MAFAGHTRAYCPLTKYNGPLSMDPSGEGSTSVRDTPRTVEGVTFQTSLQAEMSELGNTVDGRNPFAPLLWFFGWIYIQYQPPFKQSHLAVGAATKLHPEKKLQTVFGRHQSQERGWSPFTPPVATDPTGSVVFSMDPSNLLFPF